MKSPNQLLLSITPISLLFARQDSHNNGGAGNNETVHYKISAMCKSL